MYAFRGNMCTTEREKTFGKHNHREEMHMRTSFYLDGKKTTRKAVTELVGEERLKEMIQEAKETFFEDSNIQNSYFLGRRGMLTIEFA